MSDKFSRSHYKAVYGPLAQKTLHNILKRELLEQFGFESMGLIADALIYRFLKLLDEYAPERIRLLPGQLLWLAVATNEKTGYGKTMLKSKLVPVIVTVISSEDLELMAENRLTFKELRPRIVARILKEAKVQGGVLALSDIGVMLGVSSNAVSTAVKEYQNEHPEEVLPYRGTIHDMGPTKTHKLQAIELKLQGCLTKEIARQIHHDPSNVDIYQKDFERVYALFQDDKDVNQISFLTKLSRHLAEEYIKLINKYVVEEAKLPRTNFSKNEKEPLPHSYKRQRGRKLF